MASDRRDRTGRDREPLCSIALPEGARVAENNSGAMVISALIIGASIVAGSFLVRNAVDRTGDEVNALKTAIESAPRGRAAPRDAAARERIDPNRRYQVNTKGAPVRGDPDAKIAVVEFSDFQCPFCSRAVPTLDQIEQAYGDQVRIVFKHMPLGDAPEGARRARRGRGRAPPGQVLADARQDLRQPGGDEPREVPRVRARDRARSRALRPRRRRRGGQAADRRRRRGGGAARRDRNARVLRERPLSRGRGAVRADQGAARRGSREG